MSATVTTDPEVPGAQPGPGDASERGSLFVADRVVERVAGYAVSQGTAAMAAPHRVLGVNVGEGRPQESAHVHARVYGDVATIEATIAVQWPASVRSVSDTVRDRIREDVARITGVRVEQVDLEVVSMSAPAAATRRVQ